MYEGWSHRRLEKTEHKQKPRYFCCSPVFRIITSSRIWLARYVAYNRETKCVKFFVGNLEGKKQIGRPIRWWKDNTEMYLRVKFQHLNWTATRQGHVASCWEHCNENYSTVKGETFLAQKATSNCVLFSVQNSFIKDFNHLIEFMLCTHQVAYLLSNKSICHSSSRGKKFSILFVSFQADSGEVQLVSACRGWNGFILISGVTGVPKLQV